MPGEVNKEKGAKTYEFTVTLRGKGKDESEAWIDAIDNFCIDPGEHHDEVIEVDDE